MGITSLILGIIAVLFAFIPGCGIFLSIFPMILGCIFGIIGIITEKGKRAMSIIGLCLSAASIFILIFVTTGLILFSEAMEEEDDYEYESIEPAVSVTYNMKETARVGDMTVRATKAVRSEGTEEIKPREGKEFVIVTVTIQNRGRDNIYYAPQNFKIKNAQKQLQRPVENKIEEATELGYGELMPGGTVTGTIVFEVSKADKTLSLMCSDSYAFFEDTTEIRLKFE